MIVTRRGAPVLTRELAERLLCINPHGAGLAVAAGGRLTVKRERYPTPEVLLSWLAAVPEDARTLLHLRQATCGPTDAEHVQPFRVHPLGDCVFAHNGTLPGWGDASRSDSSAIAARLSVGAQGTAIAQLHVLLTEIWETGNRFALLDAKGSLAFVGEHEGIWLKEVWWSNPKQLS